MMRHGRIVAMIVAWTVITVPATAQLLPRGSLGSLPTGALTGGLLGQGNSMQPSLGTGGLANGLDSVGGTLRALSPGDLLSSRRERLRALIHDNRTVLDRDADGNPIRRDEILVTDPSPALLAQAEQQGFTIKRREPVEALGLQIVVLASPGGLPARTAIDQLRAIDPQGHFALNHVYEPAFAALQPATGRRAGGEASAPLMGLIDGGVGAHPAFADASIEQRGFAGAVKPSGHGTAVASLMVGRAGAFHGVVPGGSLLAADVYGGSEANGSAEAIVRAMGWLASRGVRVVNISLVGADNPLLAAGVRALQAKGVLVVAAVGNDGPAAPPLYPASYPGVVAVTGVDARGRQLIEAGHASHLDFAAPGADMAGAVPGGRWESLRGTSFAAPLVAASLTLAAAKDPSQALADLAAVAKPALKLGHGIVCGDCATPPRAVGLK
ncbi:MAG TPA: S8 family serine peptidase [Sphingomonas sp.]|nr:S8 family serine peptidase [Sphingomonas sp.]